MDQHREEKGGVALPPRDEPPMRAAWRLARALGCNMIPTTVVTRVPLTDGWGPYASPGCKRIPDANLWEWRRAEEAELAHGRESMAWALLPGSNRIVVLGGDSPEWTARLLERQPTPLVVRSPTPGRAHLYYRWPDGVDLGPRTNVAGVDTYDLKARGSTIHAPGSLHKSRSGRYACELPIEEQVPGLHERLPALDLALIEEDRRAVRGGADHPWHQHWGAEAERWSTDGEGERRWTAYLKATPPADQGARQSTLFRLAAKAGDFGVTELRARPGLLAWAALCSPPLDPDEVCGALLRAYPNRRSRIGCDLNPEPSTIEED